MHGEKVMNALISYSSLKHREIDRLLKQNFNSN